MELSTHLEVNHLIIEQRQKWEELDGGWWRDSVGSTLWIWAFEGQIWAGLGVSDSDMLGGYKAQHCGSVSIEGFTIYSGI